MKFDKFVIVALLILIFGGGAFLYSQQESEKHADQQAGHVFSNALVQRINEVAALKIASKETEVNLIFVGDQWVLQEKANYPADFSKVKKLIVGISDFKTIEAKTTEPEKYGRLGVQDVGESGDIDSSRIDFMSKAGNIIESVLIGKNKEARVAGASSALYVRKAAEAKSWLVSGDVHLPSNVLDWLDNSIVDIKPAEIQAVTIKNSDDTQLSIKKATAEDEHFVVLDLPEGETLKSESIADGLANSLQSLSFIDVMSRDAANIVDVTPTVAEFSTFDGLQISAKLYEIEAKHFLLLNAHAMLDEQAAKDKASKFDARLAPWAFEIAAAKTSAMKKSLADFIEPKPEPTVLEPEAMEPESMLPAPEPESMEPASELVVPELESEQVPELELVPELDSEQALEPESEPKSAPEQVQVEEN